MRYLVKMKSIKNDRNVSYIQSLYVKIFVFMGTMTPKILLVPTFEDKMRMLMCSHVTQIN